MESSHLITIPCLILAVMSSRCNGFEFGRIIGTITAVGNGNCCNTANCKEYSGRINVTRSGRDCAPWSWNPDDILNAGSTRPLITYASEDNSCRNPRPDKMPMGSWCFTYSDEPVWEYCDIPKCEDGLIDASDPELLLPTVKDNLGDELAEDKIDVVLGNKTSGSGSGSTCPRDDLLNKFLGYLIHSESVTKETNEATKTFKEIVEGMRNRVVHLEAEAKVPCMRDVEVAIHELDFSLTEAKGNMTEIIDHSKIVSEKYVDYEKLEKKIQGHLTEFDTAVQTLDYNFQGLEGIRNRN